MAKQGLQHPNWCFTFNYGGVGQPTRADVEAFWDALAEKGVHYAVGGWETGPKSGQLHLQGYVQFDGKYRLTQLKKFHLSNTVCWLPAKGDEQDNEAYCTKPEQEGVEKEIIRIGDEPRVINPGKRVKRDHGRALKLAKAGDMDELQASMPDMYLQYYRTLEDIKHRNEPAPENLSHQVRHMWLYGPTGTGKSRGARMLFKDLGMDYSTKFHNKWHSKDQMLKPGFLMDDLGIETGKVLTNYLKQWLDIYPYPAEFKGGDAMIRPKLFIITSNYHPEQIWGGTSDLQPILRRLIIRYVGPPGQEFASSDSDSPTSTTTPSITNIIGSNFENAYSNMLKTAKKCKVWNEDQVEALYDTEDEEEAEEVEDVGVDERDGCFCI